MGTYSDSHLLRLTILMSLFLTGCGAGSDTTTVDSNELPKTGVFVDSPVGGLHYQTDSLSGTTNTMGEFHFYEGETITFSIGAVDLPSTIANSIISPLDLAAADTLSDPIVVNIVRLLQSLDNDEDPTNGISIEDAIHTVGASSYPIDFSSEVFDDQPAVQDMIVKARGGKFQVVDADTAVDHYAESLMDMVTLADALEPVILTGNDYFYLVNAGETYNGDTLELSARAFTLNRGGVQSKGKFRLNNDIWYLSDKTNKNRHFAYVTRTDDDMMLACWGTTPELAALCEAKAQRIYLFTDENSAADFQSPLEHQPDSTDTDALAQAEADAVAQAEADAVAQAEADAVAQAEADAAVAQAEADAFAQAEADALAQAEADALAQAEAEAEAFESKIVNSYSCLDTAKGVTSVQGTFVEKYKAYTAQSRGFDARRAEFINDNVRWGMIDISGSLEDTGMCWAGGYVRSEKAWFASWDDHKSTYEDNLPSRNNTAIDNGSSSMKIVGLHVFNTSDAVRISEDDNWEVEAVWGEYIRDDALENDHLHSGRIYDSLFDGVYSGFSTRPAIADVEVRGDGSVLEIDKVLLRLEATPYPYKWETKSDVIDVNGNLYAGAGLPYGHGNLFKHIKDDLERNVHFKIKDSVFVMEHNLDDSKYDFPADSLIDACENVTLIWLGSGPYPGHLPSAKYPNCITIITGQAGRSLWKEKVSDWHVRHSDVDPQRKPSNPGEWEFPRRF